MNKKITVISIVFILTILCFSGCTNQDNTKTNEYERVEKNDYQNQNIGQKETISVNTVGGEFSLFDDMVKINIESQAVDTQINITVESINNPVIDPTLIMFSCFEFEPNDTTFKKPIDLIIRYNQSIIPDSVDESDIRIYVLNEDKWEVIEDSFANIAMHWAVASISHFCKMGAAAPASSGNIDNDNQNDNDDNDENGSSQYWFKANLAYTQYNKRGPSCHPDSADKNDLTEYYAQVHAWWDPVPYVHFYQIKFEFHGNPPKAYCPSCEFRDWGKYWCELGIPYYPVEGYIYQLGGDPEMDGFIGSYTRERAVCHYLDGDEMKEYTIYSFFPEGKHGFPIFGVHDTVDDQEELSDYECQNNANELYKYVLDYTDGWEVWVRGVTQTQT